MAFHAGFKETILFDQWNTNSVGGKNRILPSLNKGNRRLLCFVFSIHWLVVSNLFCCRPLRRIENRSRSTRQTGGSSNSQRVPWLLGRVSRSAHVCIHSSTNSTWWFVRITNLLVRIVVVRSTSELTKTVYSRQSKPSMHELDGE